MAEGEDGVTLLLCGDVMLGRGIDQILGHPGDPTLVESYVRDARRYVELAERVSGPIPRPVDDRWPWGDALIELQRPRSAILVLNLETSITRCDDFAPGKAVHYRMHPDNLSCLEAVAPDVCVLANNHVLDFGPGGLEESLQALERAGLVSAGAGRDRDQAHRPATVSTADARVAVLAFGHRSSGVPRGWAADGGPGVALLPDLSDRTADEVGARVAVEKERGAVVVVSVHWGSNWGYDVPREQVAFAHRLVDAGADVVHGHSSHHARPIEVRRDRLILYGCGDFVTDYEGIEGYHAYRDDLRLLYRVDVGPDGRLRSVELLPYRTRRLRLERAPAVDVAWLEATLDRVSRPYGVSVRRVPGERLGLVV